MRIPSASLPLTLVLLLGCGSEDKDEAVSVEGTAAGDCTDGADNDADGSFDCDDEGCGGSPDCADSGSDTNAAPSGAAIAIEPAAPGDDDDLACVLITEATDPNGDAVTYRYAWSKNGTDAGLAASTVSAALTTGGDTWTCTVTPTDGTLEGAPTSATVSNAQGNRAPSAPTVSITPAAPTDDDVLTCVIGTESVDPDGDAVTYSYAWSVDGADSGITAASVNAALTEAGQQWTCSVTASDGELSSSAASVSVEVAEARNCTSLELTEDYATADDSPDFDLGASFTLEAWMYTEATPNTAIGVLSRPRSSDGTGIVMGPGYVGVLGDGGACVAEAFDAFPLGEWVHLASTYDGATLSVFIDGVLADSTSCAVVPTNSAEAFQIGREFEGLGGRYFYGLLSVARVWSTPRSAAQISATMDPNADASGPELVAAWQFDEGSGTVLHDRSGNGHDAVYSNAGAWTTSCPG